MLSTNEKFLWVCELNKDAPNKIWKSGDVMEFEDEGDKDFVINSLILKTAVLGSKAIDGERNLIAIKTKGYQDKEFEQPIFSLTLGRNDMVSGLDLTLACDHSPEVEFKLIEGTGPVYITCSHMIELPSPDEQHTIMTASDGDLEEDCEEDEDIGDEEEAGEDDAKLPAKRNGNGVMKNGDSKLKNGKLMNGKNGEHNGNGIAKEAEEVGEK